MKPIRVLIVEDSPVIREFLAHIFRSDPDFEIAGLAHNGEEAVRAARLLRPSVVTMDINMPVMDGLEATRRIMETSPVPIVVVSGNTVMEELAFTFQALEAGALAVVLRPPGFHDGSSGSLARELLHTVKMMSEIKVVRRIPRRDPGCIPGHTMPLKEYEASSGIRIVAIGASTGGPLALKNLLSGLAHDFPLPILIAQHIAEGFVQGFAEWLSGASGFPVRIATQGQAISPGRAYVAPDGYHLGVQGGMRIQLCEHSAVYNGIRPSVGHLFRSVLIESGSQAAGVLLTGMGRDGADELKAMKEAGALTIAQDEKSSVVYGMPGEANKIQAARYILSPECIATLLSSLAGKSREAFHGP